MYFVSIIIIKTECLQISYMLVSLQKIVPVVDFQSAMSAAARPQLRGLLKGQLVRNVAIAAVLTTINVVLVKVFVKDARIKKYEEFYKCVSYVDVFVLR